MFTTNFSITRRIVIASVSFIKPHATFIRLQVPLATSHTVVATSSGFFRASLKLASRCFWFIVFLLCFCFCHCLAVIVISIDAVLELAGELFFWKQVFNSYRVDFACILGFGLRKVEVGPAIIAILDPCLVVSMTNSTYLR